MFYVNLYDSYGLNALTVDYATTRVKALEVLKIFLMYDKYSEIKVEFGVKHND